MLKKTKKTVSHRAFLTLGAAVVISISSLGIARGADRNKKEDAPIPGYLKGYEDLYRQNPREASLKWFKDAKFGMMVCYYLASLDGRHWFEQWKYKIPVKEYEKKMERFRAEKFDADFICDLAVEAEMKYVCFVTKHCGGFCLWQTGETAFNSMNSPAYRDLVAEMAEACRKRNLGLFMFYEHGFDWRHPDGPRMRDFPKGPTLTEVQYPTPEPTYVQGDDHDLNNYVEYVYAQITELLTNYGPVAGVWLDGASVPASGDHTKFKLQELYDQIRKLQPQALIAYKWGITGTEDFLAPELAQIKKISAAEAKAKTVELCEPLNIGWSYIKDARHEDADWVMSRLEYAKQKNMNYLLNIGNMPDGSVHPADIKTLKEVGRRLRAQSANK